jgi:SAM-dependent methyltransferase
MSSRATFDEYAIEHPQLRPLGQLPDMLIAALGGLKPADTIIDVGCGEGGTLDAIGSHGLGTIGIELSAVRAAVTRERGHSVTVADGLRLPVRAGAARIIVCRHVIEHVPDDRQALREIRRVLGPGGLLYLETPLRLRGAWYVYRDASGRRVLDPTHVREYESISQIVEILRGALFRVRHLEAPPMRFPLAHVVARGLKRMLPHSDLVTRAQSWTRATIRVPRYREIRLIAEAA